MAHVAAADDVVLSIGCRRTIAVGVRGSDDRGPDHRLPVGAVQSRGVVTDQGVRTAVALEGVVVAPAADPVVSVLAEGHVGTGTTGDEVATEPPGVERRPVAQHDEPIGRHAEPPPGPVVGRDWW